MRTDRETLTRELTGLCDRTLVDLRRAYRRFLRRDPPDCFGHDLLRRAVAHRIEELLNATTLPLPFSQLLKRVADAENSADVPVIAGKVAMTMQPGTEFIRSWQGRTYRVVVAENGFLWDGKLWTNLSEIARVITGTRWSGPRFFGLREKSNVDPDKPAPSVVGSPSPRRQPGDQRRNAGQEHV